MWYSEKQMQAYTCSESLRDQILPAPLTVINCVLCTKLLRRLQRFTFRLYVRGVYEVFGEFFCLDLRTLSKDTAHYVVQILGNSPQLKLKTPGLQIGQQQSL